MTGAYTRSGALSVRAAALARGHALLVIVQNESRPASADARCHAFTVHASVGTDRFALAVDLVVAQFAHAHVRGEAIGVLLALVPADGHANTLLGTPSWLAAADIRSGAVAAETAAFAVRLASAGRHIALVTVATVQDGNPTAVTLINMISAVLWITQQGLFEYVLLSEFTGLAHCRLNMRLGKCLNPGIVTYGHFRR